MSTSARDRLRPVLGLVAVVVTIVVLHLLGRGALAAPSVGSGPDLIDWVSARDPVTVGFVLFRLGALVLAYHLAITTTVAVVGGLLRRPDLVHRATAWTLPPFRAAVARAVGLGLSAATVLTSPAPSAVAAPPPAIVATVDAAAPGPVGTATLTVRVDDTATAEGVAHDAATDATIAPATDPASDPTDDAGTDVVAEVAVLQPSREHTGSATLQLAPTPTSPGTATLAESDTASGEAPTAEDRAPGGRRVEPRRHVVVPGDHLWSIASDGLADSLGRRPTDDEVVPYWQRVVDANPQLVDTDLLFPGDEVTVPAP